MRYYLNSPDQENAYELVKKNERYVLTNVETREEQNAQLRIIGDDYFISFNEKSWTKLRNLSFIDTYISTNKKFKVFKGYKPSSLFEEASGGLVTQIPGKVIKLQCKVGDSVQQGQTLLILEAMKMENEIKASQDGIIDSIHISEGQSLEAGTLMIEIS